MERALQSADLTEHVLLWDVLRRPIWVFDPVACCGVYANRAALKLWGAATLAELLARDFSQLSPAARARTTRLAEATASGEELSERWTFYPNGSPVTVQATISTCRLDGRRPVLLFEASPLEVESEERRAVEALRHTSTLITLFDKGGEPIFSNPAAYLAYGLSPPAFQARFPDPARAQGLLERAQDGEIVAEVHEVTTTGGLRWHHLDARRVIDPVTGVAGVLLNELDVTHRVEAEQAKAAAEQKAAMAEARQKFLTDMSHDLRTPLNAVIGFSELLKTGGLALEQTRQAARIHESGHHLLRVVDEMIRLSQGDGWTGQASDMAPAEISDPDEVEVEVVMEDRSMRILYVDDNANNRALVTAILAAQGIECQTADDGLQGVQAACAADWDIILMDIQMPVMDGIEATRAIRACDAPSRQAPIIAVTANTLSDQLESYRAAGMDDCVSKPIDIATLLDKLSLWSGSAEASHLSAAA